MAEEVWFIADSSRGLGRSVAEEALTAGRRVVVIARRTGALDDLAEGYGNRLLTSLLRPGCRASPRLS
jgi:NAD(P)-dependent dehydrogenase (short-subunit alcohol dehydrogenase family)